jgi:hypothetical protein
MVFPVVMCMGVCGFCVASQKSHYRLPARPASLTLPLAGKDFSCIADRNCAVWSTGPGRIWH